MFVATAPIGQEESPVGRSGGPVLDALRMLTPPVRWVRMEVER